MDCLTSPEAARVAAPSMMSAGVSCLANLLAPRSGLEGVDCGRDLSVVGPEAGSQLSQPLVWNSCSFSGVDKKQDAPMIHSSLTGQYLMTYISFYRNHAFICINATHFIHSSYTIQCRSVTLFYDQLKPITNHHDHHHLSLLRNPVQETWIFSRPVHNFPCRAFLGPAKTHLHASPPPWLPPSLPLAAPSCRLRSESAADRHAWGSFARWFHTIFTDLCI